MLRTALDPEAVSYPTAMTPEPQRSHLEVVVILH